MFLNGHSPLGTTVIESLHPHAPAGSAAGYDFAYVHLQDSSALQGSSLMKHFEDLRDAVGSTSCCPVLLKHRAPDYVGDQVTIEVGSVFLGGSSKVLEFDKWDLSFAAADSNDANVARERMELLRDYAGG